MGKRGILEIVSVFWRLVKSTCCHQCLHRFKGAIWVSCKIEKARKPMICGLLTAFEIDWSGDFKDTKRKMRQ